MKQKLVLLIALVLALAQGAAARELILSSEYLPTESFLTYSAQNESTTPDLSSTALESPALPDGTDKSNAPVKLYGETSVVTGDVDGDGKISIADVTALIDYLLSGDAQGINLEAADVDFDGRVTVADATGLIDVILGVPLTKPYTFLIISMIDGSTVETMIDENTKINIAKPNLIIHCGRQMQTYLLDNLAHLSYEVRNVTINTKFAVVHVSEEDREILKSMQP